MQVYRARLEDTGVEQFEGHARLVGPQTVEINGRTLKVEPEPIEP